MNGISGDALAQSVANYCRPHIRNFSSAITFVTHGCVTNGFGSTYLRARIFSLSRVLSGFDCVSNSSQDKLGQMSYEFT
jgi:hypothetical protein